MPHPLVIVLLGKDKCWGLLGMVPGAWFLYMDTQKQSRSERRRRLVFLFCSAMWCACSWYAKATALKRGNGGKVCRQACPQNRDRIRKEAPPDMRCFLFYGSFSNCGKWKTRSAWRRGYWEQECTREDREFNSSWLCSYRNSCLL